MKRLIFVYTFLTVFLGTSTVFAATKYVATCGSDTGGVGDGTTADCSSSTHKPWLTIGKALGSSGISSGDTVYIAPGTYRENVSVAMTSATAETKVLGDPQNAQGFKDGSGVLLKPNYVILTAYTTNDTTSPTGTALLTLAGRDFLTFENMVMITGSVTNSGIVSTAESHNITLRRLTFIGGRASATNTYIVPTLSADVVIHWLIEKCFFLLPNSAAMTFSIPRGTADWDVDLIIRNNVFVGGGTAVQAISMAGTTNGGNTGNPGGIKYFNNTAIGNLGLQTGANVSTTIPCLHYGNFIWNPGGKFANANTSGQITDDYTIATAVTTSTNVAAGTFSVISDASAPLIELGQASMFGFRSRVYGAPMAGSPLLEAFPTNVNGSQPTDDALSRTRPFGGGTTNLNYAIGAFERANTWREELTTVHTSGAAIASDGPGVADYTVDVKSGVATNLSVWMRYDTNHGTTTKPQMLLLYGGNAGVADQTQTMTSGVDTWEKLTCSFTPTQNGTVTIRLVARPSAANGIAYAQDDAVTNSTVIIRSNFVPFP